MSDRIFAAVWLVLRVLQKRCVSLNRIRLTKGT